MDPSFRWGDGDRSFISVDQDLGGEGFGPGGDPQPEGQGADRDERG
jgi:hypothetical protein